MFLLLFAFWLLLNGRWTLEIALTGLFVCGLVRLFCWRVLDMGLKRELRLLRQAPRLLGFLLSLLGAICASAGHTIRVIWSPRKPEPCLVSFRSELRSAWGRVLLANSITLTPGTITVDQREDRYLVHCLDRSFAEGLENAGPKRKLERLEKGGAPRG